MTNTMMVMMINTTTTMLTTVVKMIMMVLIMTTPGPKEITTGTIPPKSVPTIPTTIQAINSIMQYYYGNL